MPGPEGDHRASLGVQIHRSLPADHPDGFGGHKEEAKVMSAARRAGGEVGRVHVQRGCLPSDGAVTYRTLLLMALGFALAAAPASAQQFNSDNYLTMPYGTVTIAMSHGERNSTIVNTFSLAPNFEFNVLGNLFWNYHRPGSVDHFSTNIYAKYMLFENSAHNGGFAVLGGIGGNPGYYDEGELTNSFQTYWASAPFTLPFRGVVFLDLMPGFSLDVNRDHSGSNTSSFTHSSRIAVYRVVPHSALVGEVYGSTGDGGSSSEYKAGIRWEPHPQFAMAATFSRALDGSRGAGAEIGFMLFTPRFLCRGGCK